MLKSKSHCLQVHKFVMASFQVTLLQANAHGQDLAVWHLGSLTPLSFPVRQMTLMKPVRGGNFALYSGASIVLG